MADATRRKIHELVNYVDLTGDGQRNFDPYDVCMLVVIIISLIPLVFKEQTPLFAVIDLASALIFLIDYALRWSVADFYLEEQAPKAFLVYPFTPMALIDLASIVPSLSTLGELVVGLSGFRVLHAFRGLRALRVLRVAKLARYSKSYLILERILRASRDALLAVCGFAGGYILIAALVIFNVEPGPFDTFFDAIYWATVSLTTVGYGDIYPVTTVGRMVTMVSSVFGIAIVALPAGIITAGYMAEVRKDSKETD